MGREGLRSALLHLPLTLSVRHQMDIENQPIKVFICEVLLRTPQGLFVIASFIVNWALVGLVAFTELSSIVPPSGPLLVYIVIIPWPFVVLLALVVSSSPHYKTSLFSTAFTASAAIAPYWWLYA